jgi:copper(I)-binding protein
MLRKMVEENGQEAMEMVMSGGGRRRAEPALRAGGYHLMCMQLTKLAKPGTLAPVDLKVHGWRKAHLEFRRA